MAFSRETSFSLAGSLAISIASCNRGAFSANGGASGLYGRGGLRSSLVFGAISKSFALSLSLRQRLSLSEFAGSAKLEFWLGLVGEVVWTRASPVGSV